MFHPDKNIWYHHACTRYSLWKQVPTDVTTVYGNKLNDGISDTVAFQHDGAPAHSVIVMQKISIKPFMTDGETQLHQERGQCAHLILSMYIFFLLGVLPKLEVTKQNLITFMNYKSVFMMQLREIHQQYYNQHSEQSRNNGNTALKWTAQQQMFY